MTSRGVTSSLKGPNKETFLPSNKTLCVQFLTRASVVYRDVFEIVVKFTKKKISLELPNAPKKQASSSSKAQFAVKLQPLISM